MFSIFLVSTNKYHNMHSTSSIILYFSHMLLSTCTNICAKISSTLFNLTKCYGQLYLKYERKYCHLIGYSIIWVMSKSNVSNPEVLFIGLIQVTLTKYKNLYNEKWPLNQTVFFKLRHEQIISKHLLYL